MIEKRQHANENLSATDTKDGGRRYGRFYAANPMRRRFNAIDLLIDTPIPYLRRIAENPSVPDTLLEQLAAHSDPIIREAVADNPSTPYDVLWELAHDDA